MKDLSQTLHFFGLTEEESKIYLSCLEFGMQSISGISNLTKIGRINCYHHTDKLVKKGFLTISQKNKVKTFLAENPKIFINKEKEKLNLAHSMMPELLAIGSKNPQKPKIQFFEGKDGIKNIFEKFIETPQTEIVSFSNFANLVLFFEEKEFLKDHFQHRLEKKIKTRFISPKNRVSVDFMTHFFPENFDQKLVETFLVSSQEFNFDSEITIFLGTIAILNLNRENPIGVLIENPELYRTQKAIFDLAWLGATSFIT